MVTGAFTGEVASEEGTLLIDGDDDEEDEEFNLRVNFSFGVVDELDALEDIITTGD